MPSDPPASDPDLRLLVDGRILRPSAREGGRSRFDAVTCSFECRIVSRSLVPALGDPPHPDHRRLGVALLWLALRNATRELRLRATDPALETGFYAADGEHRWTDGRALLPPVLLPLFPDGFALELQVIEQPLTYPSG